jgi:Flp pilus assembly pilin Flp
MCGLIRRLARAERGAQPVEYVAITGLGLLLAGILVVGLGVHRDRIGGAMAGTLDTIVQSFEGGSPGTIADYDMTLSLGQPTVGDRANAGQQVRAGWSGELPVAPTASWGGELPAAPTAGWGGELPAAPLATLDALEPAVSTAPVGTGAGELQLPSAVSTFLDAMPVIGDLRAALDALAP